MIYGISNLSPIWKKMHFWIFIIQKFCYWLGLNPWENPMLSFDFIDFLILIKCQFMKMLSVITSIIEMLDKICKLDLIYTYDKVGWTMAWARSVWWIIITISIIISFFFMILSLQNWVFKLWYIISDITNIIEVYSFYFMTSISIFNPQHMCHFYDYATYIQIRIINK